MDKKNEIDSRRLQKLIRASAKQCYLNAFRAIKYVPEYADAGYVEGMAVIDGVLPIEHGWIERNDEIIDPTLPYDELVYFAGLRFKGLVGLAEGLQIPKPGYCEDLPIFYRFGWGGIESPEFRTACVAAYRHAGNEVLALQYETWGANDLLVKHAGCAVPLRDWEVVLRMNNETAGNCSSLIPA